MPEHRARGGVDDREGVGRRPSGAGRARPGSSCRPRRSRAGVRFSSGSAAAAASASGAEDLPRRGRRSAPRRRPRWTWPARTRGFAWSRIAASTRRPSSLSGSRMKYWSSASSRRDEHCEAVAAPPGPAPLLAQRGDRAGEADRDHGVEQPDVDPELERVGRGDAEQLARRRGAARSRAAARPCSRRGRARAASRRRAARR